MKFEGDITVSVSNLFHGDINKMIISDGYRGIEYNHHNEMILYIHMYIYYVIIVGPGAVSVSNYIRTRVVVHSKSHNHCRGVKTEL